MAGMVNICPDSDRLDGSPHRRQMAIAVTKHEIFHALVRRQGCVVSLLINCFRLHMHVNVSQRIELKQDKLKIFPVVFIVT